MLEDTNNLVGVFTNSLVGSVGGDWVILGLILFVIIGMALIMGRARASLVLMAGVCGIFIFSLISTQFAFMFYVAIIISGFVLLMGIRRWWTSQ